MSALLNNEQKEVSESMGSKYGIEPLRYAALRLHAVHPQDQKWILHHLPNDSQRALRALLQELKSLGIPANADSIPLEANIHEEEHKNDVILSAQADQDCLSQFKYLSIMVLSAQEKAFASVTSSHASKNGSMAAFVTSTGHQLSAIHRNLKPIHWVFALAHDADWAFQWMLRMSTHQKKSIMNIARQIDEACQHAESQQPYCIQAFLVWRMLFGMNQYSVSST